MFANLNSRESAFVARVAAMESNLDTSDSDRPANPILAAQRIVNTASALAQISERPFGSPLRQEAVLPTPMLKRNYGSLNLSQMSRSSSSSSSSSFSSPTSARFPRFDTQFPQDEDAFSEQDDSPTSSPSSSPMVEFSTHGQFSQELEVFGVVFGPDLTPEFVSDDERLACLDFMDTLEDCDALGRFAETVQTSKTVVSSGDPNTTKPVLTLKSWRPDTIGFLLTNPNHSSSAGIIQPSGAESMTMGSLLTPPNPLFDIASPQITQAPWGLQNPVLDSAPWAKVASPVAGSGSFETLQWIPAIALLALVVKLVMESTF